MKTITKYFSLVKFSHTIFALPFALIGFFLAYQRVQNFDYKVFVLVLFCMIFARTAAMAFNRLLDRKIDAQNPRTASREIPAGKLSANNVALFVASNAILFIATTYLINPLVFYLSPVALVVILGYSYTKRFTALCHFVLGLGLSLAPIGAYLAVTAEFALTPLLFSILVLFWVSGFDIIYALQDDQFDLSQKLKSVPVLLGRKGALLLSQILHLAAAILVTYIGLYNNFPASYWFGGILFIGLLIYQHSLVKPHDLRKVDMAFFTTNGIASVSYAIFVIWTLLS